MTVLRVGRPEAAADVETEGDGTIEVDMLARSVELVTVVVAKGAVGGRVGAEVVDARALDTANVLNCIAGVGSEVGLAVCTILEGTAVDNDAEGMTVVVVATVDA